MQRILALLLLTILCLACHVCADYLVSNEGQWPANWSKELEPLRKQSRTLEGPLHPLLHHAIPFTNREEFEAVWPHIVSVKTKGAPIVLRRGPSFWFDDKKSAGVCIHTPPEGQAPNTDLKSVRGNWEQTIYIELIVDGQIVDLNRIPFPADTPIIDERFPTTTVSKDSK
ncbi:MAG: hypothetical protein DWH91_14910 [Planctomycetota bacterium]|nr:MAG: hypothetical protein DWH91_14910 [Planctomycetota bacterium]